MWYAASRHAVLGLRLRPRVTGSTICTRSETRDHDRCDTRHIPVYHSAQPARELATDLEL